MFGSTAAPPTHSAATAAELGSAHGPGAPALRGLGTDGEAPQAPQQHTSDDGNSDAVENIAPAQEGQVLEHASSPGTVLHVVQSISDRSQNLAGVSTEKERSTAPFIRTFLSSHPEMLSGVTSMHIPRPPLRNRKKKQTDEEEGEGFTENLLLLSYSS